MTKKSTNILITGAARRVGRAIALGLAKPGVNLIIHYNSSAKDALSLKGELTKLGAKVFLLQADLSKLIEVKNLAKEVHRLVGHVDVLVNNASSFFPTPLGTTTESQWENLFATNAKAPFFLAETLGLKMKKSGGVIINIADWAALRPYFNYVPYCAAKAALIAISQGLAKSLAPKVRVNTILPGPVMWPSDLSAAEKKAVVAKTLLKKMGKAADIVRTVKFIIESDFMTGSLIHIDGGRSLI